MCDIFPDPSGSGNVINHKCNPQPCPTAAPTKAPTTRTPTHQPTAPTTAPTTISDTEEAGIIVAVVAVVGLGVVVYVKCFSVKKNRQPLLRQTQHQPRHANPALEPAGFAGGPGLAPAPYHGMPDGRSPVCIHGLVDCNTCNSPPIRVVQRGPAAAASMGRPPPAAPPPANRAPGVIEGLPAQPDNPFMASVL